MHVVEEVDSLAVRVATDDDVLGMSRRSRRTRLTLTWFMTQASSSTAGSVAVA